MFFVPVLFCCGAAAKVPLNVWSVLRRAEVPEQSLDLFIILPSGTHSGDIFRYRPLTL